MIKKYRAVKLWLIMALCVALCVGGIILMKNDDNPKSFLYLPVLIICTVIIAIAFLWCLTFFIEFEQDRILIRHGHWSTKNFWGKFGTRTIMKDEITTLWLDRKKLFVRIRLKDETELTYNFGGYFQVDEIFDEFASIEGITKYSS